MRSTVLFANHPNGKFFLPIRGYEITARDDGDGVLSVFSPNKGL